MHTWQDIVLAFSLLAFNAALLPSIWGKQKPRFATSTLTALFLLPQLVVFVSLSLWYSFVMTLINTALWTILAAQRLAQMRSKKRS